MADIVITKEFDWDMAHMLAGHEGICRNLHGHTYRMQVEAMRSGKGLITGADRSDEGMVIDFKALKDMVKNTIVEPLDHAFMYWEKSPDPMEHQIAALLRENNRKVAQVSYRPTVEEMALNFLEILNKECVSYGIVIRSVTVWETPNNFATARLEV